MMAYEDPSELIDHATHNFKIQPDKERAARIKDHSIDRKEARETRLQQARSSRRKVSVQLQRLETKYQETVEVHDSVEHSVEMEKLANEELETAKEASRIEEENDQLERKLQELQKELSELESQGVEGSESIRQSRENLNTPLLMRLGIYRRSLPIVPIPNEAGIFNKIVITNRRSGLDVIHVDSEIPPYEYANHLWSYIGE